MPKAPKATTPAAKPPPKRTPAKAAKSVVAKTKAAKRPVPRRKIMPARKSGAGSNGPNTGSPYTTLTPLVIDAFLHELAQTANVTMVCNELRINRLTIYHMKNSDPEFLAKFNEAIAKGHDAWEDEAARRAFKGYKREVYQQGLLVGHTTEFSDSLAQFILRGAKPEQYRERTSQEVNLKGGITAKLESLADEDLNAAINAKLIALGPKKVEDKS